jgi:outer membrane protein TolC
MNLFIKRVGLLLFMWLVLFWSGCSSQEQIAREFQRNRQGSYQEILREKTTSVAAADSDTDDTTDGQMRIVGPLSIERAVALAIVHNRDIQAAKLRLIEAKARMTEATSTALPHASFGGQALWRDDTGFDPASIFGAADEPADGGAEPANTGSSQDTDIKETYNLQLLLRQPLYLGGLIGTALDAATVFAYQTQQQLRLTVQQLQERIRREYLAVLLEAQLKKTATQARLNASELLQDTKKKLQLGVGRRLDVLRAEVQLSAMDAELVRRKNGHQLALTQLLNTLGVSQSSEVILTDQLEYQPIKVAADCCLAQAVTGHPSLLIGEANVRLAHDNVRSQQAGDRPKVYLQGSYGRNYPGAIASFSGDKRWERAMDGGIVVEWPIFDGFATRGRTLQAKSQLDQQRVALKKLQEEIHLQVTQGILNLQANEEFLKTQHGNVNNAEEALRLAQIEYRQGTATSLDVISSELALVSAHADYYRAVHAYQMSLLDISAAVGIIGEEPIPVIEDAAHEIEPQNTTPAQQKESQSDKEMQK